MSYQISLMNGAKKISISEYNILEAIPYIPTFDCKISYYYDENDYSENYDDNE